MDQSNKHADCFESGLNRADIDEIRQNIIKLSIAVEEIKNQQQYQHKKQQQMELNIQLAGALPQQRIEMLNKIVASKEVLFNWLIKITLENMPLAHHVAQGADKSLFRYMLALLEGLLGEEKYPFFIACNSLGDTIGHCLMHGAGNSVESVAAYFDCMQNIPKSMQIEILTKKNKELITIGDLVLEHSYSDLWCMT